jgi:hypothetical protein
MRGRSGPRDSQTDNIAHPARHDANVAFHVHQHGDGWQVTEAENQECSQKEECRSENVEGSDTDQEAE